MATLKVKRAGKWEYLQLTGEDIQQIKSDLNNHVNNTSEHTVGNDVAIHVGNTPPDPSLYPNRKILFFNTAE